MGGGSAQDRIERYADRIDARLRADERSTKTMRAFTDSALRRVLLDCGFKKRGPRNIALIEEALERRNVFADPPLTLPGLDWDQRINFTRTPPRPRPDEQRVRFRTEHDLELFLVDNFRYVFPDLKFKGPTVRGGQRKDRHPRGRPGRLCRDRAEEGPADQ